MKRLIGNLPDQPGCKVYLHEAHQPRLRRKRLVFAYGGGPDFTQDNEFLVGVFVKALCETGTDVVTFDYRGRGEGQTMKDGNSSLATRAEDLCHVVCMVKHPDVRLVLMGHSMGGPAVVESLRRLDVRDVVSELIISVPAAYPEPAFYQPFGSKGWGEAIHPPEDEKWRDAREFSVVSAFSLDRPVLLIRSSPGCPIIPDGLIDLYSQAISHKNGRTIPGPHQMFNTPERALQLADVVIEFLKSA